MNISLHYALIYDIFFNTRPEVGSKISQKFHQKKKNEKTKVCQTLASRLLSWQRYRPINIHLNNNEIIIIFTEQNRASRGFQKLSSLFFHAIALPKLMRIELARSLASL